MCSVQDMGYESKTSKVLNDLRALDALCCLGCRGLYRLSSVLIKYAYPVKMYSVSGKSLNLNYLV